ncbi:MAG: Mov34/MPN/PAD-1 family protein [Methanomassiliicoccales archaeon]|jgi:proteasome lid subunit RPN8/RPN11
MRKKPIITASMDLAIEKRPRPMKERCRPHKWLSDRSCRLFAQTEEDGFELYVSRTAEERIRNHALSKKDEMTEVMGFLLGSVYEDGGRTYALVRDVATTDLDATSVSVKFDREGFERLFESMDDSCFNYVIVGWYHSHPGHGCFLSQTDVDTQAKMFSGPYHSALVIDPVNIEIAAFRLKEGAVEERPFAIYWDEYQNPYFGETVIARKKRFG